MKQIALTQGYFALVDDDDYETVSLFNWSAVRCGNKGTHIYARTRFDGSKIVMHRFILRKELADDPKGIVDHINRNTLNNRRENLRITDSSGNNRNKDWVAYALSRARSAAQSNKAAGVCFDKSVGKWKAYFRNKHLGWFTTEEAALVARQKAVEEIS